MEEGDEGGKSRRRSVCSVNSTISGPQSLLVYLHRGTFIASGWYIAGGGGCDGKGRRGI